MQYWQLTPAGVAAAKDFAAKHAWNADATIDEIAQDLENRGPHECLDVEMRGPNYKGWGQGLVWFSPEPHHVELITEHEEA